MLNGTTGFAGTSLAMLSIRVLYCQRCIPVILCVGDSFGPSQRCNAGGFGSGLGVLSLDFEGVNCFTVSFFSILSGHVVSIICIFNCRVTARQRFRYQRIFFQVY